MGEMPAPERGGEVTWVARHLDELVRGDVQA